MLAADGFPDFNHYNLKINERTPGVVLEYDGNPADPHEARDNLQMVTGDIIIAADAVLRGDGRTNSLYAQVNGIADELVAQGLVPDNSPSLSPHYANRGITGLFHLSAELTNGLLNPRKSPYTIGGMGTPSGGYNEFGQVAASLGFDYNSPLGTGVDDAHWYKTTFQFIQDGPGRLAVGAYAIGMHQLLSPNKMRAELRSLQLQQYLGHEPTARFAEHQPFGVPELQFDEYLYEEKITGLRIPGFNRILSETAERTGFEYTPFSSESSRYNANAVSTLIDPRTGFGLRAEARGGRKEFGDGVEYQLHYDSNEDALLPTMNGEPVKLESANLKIVPVRLNENGQYATYRQEQNVLPTHLHDTARQLGECVTTLYDNLRADK
jgi:hypothetical protein